MGRRYSPGGVDPPHGARAAHQGRRFRCLDPHCIRGFVRVDAPVDLHDHRRASLHSETAHAPTTTDAPHRRTLARRDPLHLVRILRLTRFLLFVNLVLTLEALSGLLGALLLSLGPAPVVTPGRQLDRLLERWNGLSGHRPCPATRTETAARAPVREAVGPRRRRPGRTAGTTLPRQRTAPER